MLPLQGHSLVAQKLVDKIETFIRDLVIPGGYTAVFVGHSLGGSLACASAIILRARLAQQYPEILTDNGRMIKVIALAPAPFVDRNVAMQCKPFITSVVNNSDAIPRWSINNLCHGLHFLRIVRRRMDSIVKPTSHFRFLQYLKYICSSTPVLTMDEVELGLCFAHEEMKNSEVRILEPPVYSLPAASTNKSLLFLFAGPR